MVFKIVPKLFPEWLFYSGNFNNLTEFGACEIIIEYQMYEDLTNFNFL